MPPKSVLINGIGNLVGHIDSVNKDRAERGERGSSIFNVLNKTWDNSKQEQIQGKTMSNKLVRVRSNFARSKTIVLDNGALILNFDAKGEAEFPAHLKPLLDAEMVIKPGRYTYLPDDNITVELVVTDPESIVQEPVEVADVVEKETETVVSAVSTKKTAKSKNSNKESE